MGVGSRDIGSSADWGLPNITPAVQMALEKCESHMGHVSRPPPVGVSSAGQLAVCDSAAPADVFSERRLHFCMDSATAGQGPA
jgi:hypothetical protein